MKWTIYNLLFALVYPFLLPGFLARMLRRGGYAARFGDRFALYPEAVLKAFGRRTTLSDSHAKLCRPGAEDASSPFVWIHAVSVGEVQVAGQLMREWRKAEPGVRFCFSTTSSTGWKMAEREVGPEDVLIYNPLDFPNFVKSALLTVRPRAIVLTESEIWPNFIRRAMKYGIPLFLINARVSDRSAPRYKLAKCFFGDVFSCFTRIFAQSDLDKARLVAAGAPADRTDVTGSFKFDVARRNPAKEEELRAWLAASEGAGKILLGGSTWPGEDEVLLKIYARLVNEAKGAGRPLPRLVLAPRHFEKADAVEANIRKAGFACIRRSRTPASGTAALGTSSQTDHALLWSDRPRSDVSENLSLPMPDRGRSGYVSEMPDRGRSGYVSEMPDRGRSGYTPSGLSAAGTAAPVFLADTTGELMGLYALADVVFVGKSLCAHGSQNMIEPCLCGKPTFVGPYTENFRPVMSDLLAAKAIEQVKDAAELEEKICALFGGTFDGASLGARASAAVVRRQGVVPACVKAIRGAL